MPRLIAEAKTVRQAIGDWERSAKTGAPHRTLFEVAEVIVAAGEVEVAVARVKVNERVKKCRARAKEDNPLEQVEIIEGAGA